MKTLEASVEERNCFDAVMAEVHEMMERQEQCSHFNRDRIADAEIRGAPDLVIEILSPATEARDRGYKKALYGRYGVREYWLVDGEKECVEVYGLEPDGYGLAGSFAKGDMLTSPLLTGLRLATAEVFRED